MDLDGQAIERRDFPISRRGYEPAAVDAHLRALAAAVAELRDRLSGGETLGASAASQVQSIIDAAEQAAAEIARDAQLGAQRTRQEAERDAARTRADAIARAERLIAAAQVSTEDLQRRLEGMDGQVRELAGGLIAGVARLGGELGQAQRGMAALFDSAGGAGPQAEAAPAVAAAGAAVADADADAGGAEAGLVAAAADTRAGETADAVPAAAGTVPPASNGGAPARSADVDGARLVALNMALNGESREETGRYLAESFELADPEKLLEEVYAAIEG